MLFSSSGGPAISGSTGYFEENKRFLWKCKKGFKVTSLESHHSQQMATKSQVEVKRTSTPSKVDDATSRDRICVVPLSSAGIIT